MHTKAQAGRKRRSPNIWIPNQHGAWAMLLWPYLLGVILAARNGQLGWYALPLFGCWLIGYFAFFCVSQWLKSKRKPKFFRPAATYTLITAGFALITWALAGWALALWLVVYFPLMSIALAMAAARRERDLLAGILTVVAAQLMVLVVGWADPRELLAWDQAVKTALTLVIISVVYFAGTIWYVKTLIRERGKLNWLLSSVAYHLAVTLVSGYFAATGLISPWWVAFFAICTLRAAIVPAWWPMRGRNLHPKHVGRSELAVTAILILLSLVTT